ncbi:helicase [Penicillium samsonianum]|uniref:helicase n=1 Tax=Penicillium samsonianum TaxID=1882272 RepID=UPI002547A8E7|nr:helicase [Penicillium samsonianum]KAJ6150203.1 helicase [Penicillium samsonianum]
MPQPSAGPFGGIIADEMGLGKTLTTLATIITTLNHAEATVVSNKEFPELPPKQKTMATLIIVPSEGEIRDCYYSRVVPGTLVACRYHGQSRESQNLSFEHKDIVLTTYGTVTSEFRLKRGLLHKTDFFRVVLDEAHHIRSRSGIQYAAVCGISASRRWCLTGTPIQNKLEDLGALVSFLQFPLLGDKEMFRVYIVNQSYRNSPTRFDNLRLLLGCICLRRTKKVGHLAEPRAEILYLDLSPTEAQGYSYIVEHHRTALDKAVSSGSSINTKNSVFQALMQLRIYCNNGICGSEDCETPGSQDLDLDEYFLFLQQNNEAQCASCNREIQLLSDLNIPTSGAFAQCRHLLCSLCVTLSKSSVIICPGCKDNTLPLIPATNSSHHEDRPTALASNRILDSMHVSEPLYSTKLHALLNRIMAQPSQEKCIVFSAWKKSLDLAAAMLRDNQIGYTRVDGSISSADRRSALTIFNDDTQVNVLLITVGTGAVGLNLTSATRVHIMEPQWNPMVERQAIGRVVRLGQTKDVTITRYIMRGTVEEVAIKGFEQKSSGDTTS